MKKNTPFLFAMLITLFAVLSYLVLRNGNTVNVSETGNGPKGAAIFQQSNSSRKAKSISPFSRSRDIRTQVDLLAEISPKSALEYLKSIKNDSLRRTLCRYIMEKWLSRDPKTAFAYIDTISKADPADLNYIVLPALDYLLVQGGEPSLDNLMKFVNELGPQKYFSGPLNNFGVMLMSKDVGLATAFVKQLDEGPARKILETELEIANARSQGISFLKSIDFSRPEDIPNNLQVGAAVSAAFFSNQKQTLEFLTSKAGSASELDSIKSELVRHGMSLANEDALDLASTISNETTRQLVETVAFQKWLLADSKEAEIYAFSEDIPISVIAPSLSRFYVGDKSFEQTLKDTSLVKDTATRTRKEAIVYWQWASTNAEQARGWLSNAKLADSDRSVLLAIPK